MIHTTERNLDTESEPRTDAPDKARGARGRPVPRSRLGGLWVTLTSGAVVLLLLLIFILENGQSVDVAFFGAHGHLPVGVALLLAAILGVLLVVVPGAGRMVQLRRAARRRSAPAPAPDAVTVPPRHERPAAPEAADTNTPDPAVR